ncbi:DUF805 domain-containing protein [Pseudosulfitobacter pseudonitzschiae]|uniref:DUF805 domain-containing protein n=1 Tax=Pseudosulfitobacter pseudonitzschiae TaxID=1402135 RepID=UPI003B7EF2FF
MSKPVFEDILNYKTGRRNRKSYALAFLVLSIASLGFTALSLSLVSANSTFTAVLLLLSIPLSILLVICQIAISSQRLRDIGYSGWFLLLMLIPFASLVVQVFLFFAPGQAGENTYGSDPRNMDEIEIFGS